MSRVTRSGHPGFDKTGRGESFCLDENPIFENWHFETLKFSILKLSILKHFAQTILPGPLVFSPVGGAHEQAIRRKQSENLSDTEPPSQNGDAEQLDALDGGT